MERKGAIEMETKKKGTPPPRYDEAFKAGAVRMVTEQGRQPTEVAKDLGICIDTLRNWLKSSGIQWVRQAVRAGNSSVSGSWKQRTVLCASSWVRRTRSLIS